MTREEALNELEFIREYLDEVNDTIYVDKESAADLINKIYDSIEKDKRCQNNA